MREREIEKRDCFDKYKIERLAIAEDTIKQLEVEGFFTSLNNLDNLHTAP